MNPADRRPVRIVFQPAGLRVDVDPPANLLAAARDAGAGLASECGGKGTCGRCRVRLDAGGAVNPPTDTERKRLGAEGIGAGLRLACQVTACDVVTVTLPPESMTAPQRIQTEGLAEVEERDPPTKILDVELAEPSTADPRPDWERLSAGLREAAGPGSPDYHPPRLPVLRVLGRVLRASGWRVRAGFRGDRLRWLLPGGTPALGLAVDIGTTKVAGWLLDLDSGETLASAGLMNAQIAYGEDVMSRIAAVTENPDMLDRLRREVTGTVNDLARQACAEATDGDRKAGGRRFGPEQIVECVFVGNTVMHHLFLGLPVEPLGVAPFTPAVTAPVECRAVDLGLVANENAGVYLPPGVSGFIGSDHVAMMLATGALRKRGVVLGVDVGTNTEISLVTGGRAVSCSASSGPAFEGAHVEYGMRASAGAIEAVRLGNDGAIEFRTVGGAAPMGFCGSGILDAVAELRRCGAVLWHGSMDQGSSLVRPVVRGRFAGGPEGNGHEILVVPGTFTGHGRDITIGRKDVGSVQLAKAAIRSGIDLLMERVGVAPEDIEEVLVAGAFGATLNIQNALDIGLFPPIPPERFRRVGNAAGAGAQALLLSKRLRDEAVRLAADLEHYELTSDPSFQSRFIGALSLGGRS